MVVESLLSRAAEAGVPAPQIGTVGGRSFGHRGGEGATGEGRSIFRLLALIVHWAVFD